VHQLVLYPWQRNYFISNLKNDEERSFFPKFLRGIKNVLPEALLDEIVFYTSWNEEEEEETRWFYWNKSDSLWQLPTFKQLREKILKIVGEEQWNDFLERIGNDFPVENDEDEENDRDSGGNVADDEVYTDTENNSSSTIQQDSVSNSSTPHSEFLQITSVQSSPSNTDVNNSPHMYNKTTPTGSSSPSDENNHTEAIITMPALVNTPESDTTLASEDDPLRNLCIPIPTRQNVQFSEATSTPGSNADSTPPSNGGSPTVLEVEKQLIPKMHPSRRKSIFAFNLSKQGSSNDVFSDFDTVNPNLRPIPRSNTANELMFESQDLNDEQEIASVLPTSVVSSRSNSLEKYDRKNLSQDTGRGNLENTMEKELFPFFVGCGENRILSSVKANIIKEDNARREAHIVTIARDWSGQYVIVVSAIRSEKRLSTRRSRSQSITKAPASVATLVLPIIQSVELIEDPNDEIILEIDQVPLRMQLPLRAKEKLLSSLRFVLHSLNRRNTSHTKTIHNQIACIDFTLEIYPVTCELATVERIYNQLFNAFKQGNPIDPLLFELRTVIRESRNRDHLLIRLALLIKMETTSSMHPFVLRVTEQILVCPRPIKKIGESWLALIKYLQGVVSLNGALAKRASAVVKRISELYAASLTYESKAASMKPVSFPQDFLTGISVLSRRERQVAMHTKEIRAKSVGEGVFLAFVYYTDTSEVLSSSTSFLPRFQLSEYTYEDAVEDGLTDKYSEALKPLLCFGSSWASSLHKLKTSKKLPKFEKSLSRLLGSLTDFKVNEWMDLGILYDRPSHFPSERTVILYTVHKLTNPQAMLHNVQYDASTSPTRYALAPVSHVEHEFLEYYYPNFHPLAPLERMRKGFHNDRWIQNCVDFCNSKKPLESGTFLTFFRFRISEHGLQVQVDSSNRFCTPHIRIAEYDVRKCSKQWRWVQSLRLRQYLKMTVVTASDVRAMRDFPKRENIQSVRSFRARFFIAMQRLKYDYNLQDLGLLLDEKPLEIASGNTLLLAYVSFCVSDEDDLTVSQPGVGDPLSSNVQQQYCSRAVWKDVDVLDSTFLEIYQSRVFEMRLLSYIEALKRGESIRFTNDEFKYSLPYAHTSVVFDWLQRGGTSVVGELHQYSPKEVDAHTLYAILEKTTQEQLSTRQMYKQIQTVVHEESECITCSWQTASERAQAVDETHTMPVVLRSLQVDSQRKHVVRSGGLSQWVQFSDDNDARPQLVSPFGLNTIADTQHNEHTPEESIDICWSITHELIDTAFLDMFRDATEESAEVLCELLDEVERLAHIDEEGELERQLQEMCSLIHTDRYRVKQQFVDEFYEYDYTDATQICPLSPEDLVQRMSCKFSTWVDNAHSLMTTIVSTQQIVELHDSMEEVDDLFVAREGILFDATTNAAAHMPEPVPMVSVSLADAVSESNSMLSEEYLRREANKNFRLANKLLFPSTAFSAQIQTVDKPADLADEDSNLLLDDTMSSQSTNTRAIHFLSQNGDELVGFLHARKQHRARMLFRMSETQNPIVTNSSSTLLGVVCDYLCLSSSEVKPFLRSLEKRLSQQANVEAEKLLLFCKRYEIPVLFMTVLLSESSTLDEFQIVFAASFLAELSLNDYFKYEEELAHQKEIVDVMWYVRFRMDLPEIVSPVLKYSQFEGRWRKHYSRKRIETVMRHRIAVLPHSQVAEEVRLWKKHLGYKVKQINLKSCKHITDDELELLFATCKRLRKVNLSGTSVCDPRELATLYDLESVKIVLREKVT